MTNIQEEEGGSLPPLRLNLTHNLGMIALCHKGRFTTKSNKENKEGKRESKY
jgi:hypothetical protein